MNGRKAFVVGLSLAGCLATYGACSVGAIDYTNLACDDGACPSPWLCTHGRCSLSVADASGTTDARADVARDGMVAGDGGCTDAAPTRCGTACTNTAVDTHNCGVCGHDCLGTPCAVSMCTPLVLAAGLVQPHGIALDDANVYFTTYDNLTANGAVYRVPKGGGKVVTLATGQSAPSIPVVAGSSLYWTNNGLGQATGSVESIALDGGARQTRTSGQPGPFGLALSATTIYIAMNNADFIGTEGLVGDGGLGSLATTSAPFWVALNDTTMFVTLQTMVARASLDGGPFTPIATGLSEGWGLAIDGTNAYFSDDMASTVAQVPLDGGAVVTLSSVAGAAPRGIAVDQHFVYWVERYGGNVSKVPIGGGQVTTLAMDQSEPNCLAIDETSVYWTDFSGNAIMKVAK